MLCTRRTWVRSGESGSMRCSVPTALVGGCLAPPGYQGLGCTVPRPHRAWLAGELSGRSRRGPHRNCRHRHRCAVGHHCGGCAQPYCPRWCAWGRVGWLASCGVVVGANQTAYPSGHQHVADGGHRSRRLVRYLAGEGLGWAGGDCGWHWHRDWCSVLGVGLQHGEDAGQAVRAGCALDARHVLHRHVLAYRHHWHHPCQPEAWLCWCGCDPSFLGGLP